MIASDHAPHHADEKARGMDRARRFGIVGLETTLGAGARRCVHAGVADACRRRSARSPSAPARVLGLAAGRLAPGSVADVTLIDPERRWTVDPASFRSRSRNTPFAGRRCTGKALAVCLGGRVVDGDLDGRFTR